MVGTKDGQRTTVFERWKSKVNSLTTNRLSQFTSESMKELSTIFITLLLTVSTLSSAAQPESTVSPSQLSGMSQVYRRGTPRRNFMLRRAKAAQDKGPGGNFYKGERHQLTVLAAFADQDFLGDSAATVSQWNKICNTEHLQEAPFCGSVHDYFSDQSYGQLNLIFDLQFIRVGNRSRYRSTRRSCNGHRCGCVS